MEINFQNRQRISTSLATQTLHPTPPSLTILSHSMGSNFTQKSHTLLEEKRSLGVSFLTYANAEPTGLWYLNSYTSLLITLTRHLSGRIHWEGDCAN